MGARPAAIDRLFVPGSSAIHRLPPQCKVAATFLFVVAVVATPREELWAFAVLAALLVGVAAAARLPARALLPRLVVEAPFLLFAALLPVVGRGERVEVLGVSLSVAGLWAAWNIVAKATLGLSASVILVATTAPTEILRGLERLRVPAVLVAIAGFMLRYVTVVTDELHRMRVARLSRGADPRWLWQARDVAATAGTLFVRTYERGERVYLAMVSRGYSGSVPAASGASTPTAPAGAWAIALAVPTAAGLVAALAWWLR